MGLLCKMILTNRRLYNETKKNPLEYHEALERKKFQLPVWNQDENLARENKSDHIKKACDDLT